MAKPEKVDFSCDTCGSEMKNRGGSANSCYLVIECPVCGEAFLLSKTFLRSKKEWEKLYSAIL
jgi:predicted RNA-binding Zn-ribbon protein involved in translation (DUF1610 family)